ncbi:MAG: transporter associated domain-containing protein [Pseudomonadota bacterium]
MSDDKPPSSAGPERPGFWQRLRQAFATGPRDRSEFLQIIREGRDRQLFDRDAHGMLEGVLDVSEKQVRDVMVPRPHMVVVERDADMEELLRIIVASGHSRFPVIGDDRDEVVGILLAKDLLRSFVDDPTVQFQLKDHLRAPVFVPESKRLNILLKEFRASHNHMAVVVDEYGGVCGLATIEDVIEQIVGEIDDEHDIEDEATITRESDNVFTVRAVTRIDEFNAHFGGGFDDENYDTVGGLIMHELGRLPRRGESLTIRGLDFRITRCDRRRIEAVQVSVPDAQPAARETTG